METNDGTNTGVEPKAKGAPGVEGKEQQEPGQPEGIQKSNGEPTLEGGKGTAKPAWMAQLPNDLKEDADLQQYATLGDFVRGIKGKTDGSESKEGSEGGTEPVKYENFETSLGEDHDPFGTVSESLKTTLEESGIPQEVAEKVFSTLSEGQKGSMDKLVETGKDWCEAQLKKNWGDQYEAKRKAMTRAYIALVQPDEELAGALDRSGASINPAVAEIFARIGEGIKEDGSFPSNSTTSGDGRSSKVPVHYPD